MFDKLYSVSKETEFPMPASFIFDLNLLPQSTSAEDILHFEFLKNIQAQLTLAGFVPSSSLHSPQAYSFYDTILKAPPFVLDVIQRGYTPDFISEPVCSYSEPNNSSALNNLEFVREVFI